MRRGLLTASGLAGLILLAACATVPRTPPSTAPAYPAYPMPAIPLTLKVSPDVRARHDAAWGRLQAGDERTATREFAALVKLVPGFYPAETGLGFAALAARQFKPAVAWFTSALSRDNRYVPAWHGLVEAQLGLENLDEGIAALERLVALDPRRDADRTRLELLRLRQVQALMESARRARQAGRLDEADAMLTRALAASGTSTVILRELAAVESALGQHEDADAHARRAIALDPKDAESHAALAKVLEARGRLRDAAAAYARAAALDPVWRDTAARAAATAEDASVTAELRGLAAAATVTRGQLAALVGLRFESQLVKAPQRAPQVATDIRTHWAARWVGPVTQAGVMDVFSNHTFQPAGIVRRGDLAQVLARLLPLVMGGRADALAKWQALRPALPDVAASNLYYRPAALAIASGTLTTDDGGRFGPTRAVTGAELLAALARVEQLAVR